MSYEHPIITVSHVILICNSHNAETNCFAPSLVHCNISLSSHHFSLSVFGMKSHENEVNHTESFSMRYLSVNWFKKILSENAIPFSQSSVRNKVQQNDLAKTHRHLLISREY